MFIILLISLIYASSVFAEASPKKILIIESYHENLDWDQAYVKAIKKSLGQGYIFNNFAMDTKRIAPHQFKQQAQKAWDAYRQYKPDLIISGDDNALKLLADRYQSVDTPVVYLGINSNPRHYFKTPPINITGVLERPMLLRSILNLKQLLGQKVKKVMILFDSGTTANLIFQENFQDQNMIMVHDIEVHIGLHKNYKSWKHDVMNAKKNHFDALIVGLYHTVTDQNGQHIPSESLLSWTNKNSKVPLFAFWKVAVGKGKAIGGLVLNSIEQGKEAAKIAKMILEKNVKPSDIFPKKPVDGDLIFSKHELKRFKIDLPKSWASSVTLIE